MVNVSRKHVNGSTVKAKDKKKAKDKAKDKKKAMGPIHVAARYCNPLINIMTEM